MSISSFFACISLSAKDAERFNQHGLQSGVEVEWAEQNTLKPLLLPYPIPKSIYDSEHEMDEIMFCINLKHKGGWTQMWVFINKVSPKVSHHQQRMKAIESRFSTKCFEVL